MAVLVTGATGFVGLNIVRALAARGQGVVLFAPQLPASLAELAWLRPLRFVAGDVRSSADLARAFAAAAITHVVHAAALTPDEAAERRDPRAVADINLLETIQVFQAAHQARVARLLHLSSVAVYGAPTGPDLLDEAISPPAPTSLYGITKLAAEQTVRRLAALHGTDAMIVRLGPCFGRFEHPTGARVVMSPHWQIVEHALAGGEALLPRALAADWLDAATAGRAIADLLVIPPGAPALLNLGAGAVTTAAAWCEEVKQCVPGFRWRIDAERSNVRITLAGDRPALGVTRLHAAIGWHPAEAGLATAAADYLAWRRSAEGAALMAPSGAA